MKRSPTSQSPLMVRQTLERSIPMNVARALADPMFFRFIARWRRPRLRVIRGFGGLNTVAFTLQDRTPHVVATQHVQCGEYLTNLRLARPGETWRLAA